MRSTLPPSDQARRPTTDASERRPPITHGDEVEIWCRSLGVWSSGFEAVDLDADGWKVLRRSDGAPLPVRFADTDLRPVPRGRQRPLAG